VGIRSQGHGVLGVLTIAPVFLPASSWGQELASDRAALLLNPHTSHTFVGRAWRRLSARCFDQGGAAARNAVAARASAAAAGRGDMRAGAIPREPFLVPGPNRGEPYALDGIGAPVESSQFAMFQPGAELS